MVDVPRGDRTRLLAGNRTLLQGHDSPQTNAYALRGLISVHPCDTVLRSGYLTARIRIVKTALPGRGPLTVN